MRTTTSDHVCLALLLGVGLGITGCGADAKVPNERVHGSSTPVSVSVASPAHDALPCLPLVSGCGCSYACADAIHKNADGSYRVTWFGLDSTTLAASLGTLTLPDGRKVTAFEDGTACGGECIPTAAHAGCHRNETGSCVP